MENKKGVQIEAYIYKKAKGENLFLILKRVPTKCGFWQPITGGYEEGLDQDLAETVRREVREETGIENIISITDTAYSFNFTDKNKHNETVDYTEYVYGVEVAEGAQVQISGEHEEFLWVSASEALSLLKWDTNKSGLQALLQIL